MPPETTTTSPATSTAAPAGSESAGATAAASSPPAAAPGAAAADDAGGAAPASDTGKAADAGATAPAAPAASEAPAAEAAKATDKPTDATPESAPSLLEAASAKPAATEGEKPAATEAKPTDGAKAGDKPAADAKPATDAKPDADKKPAEKPADAKSDKKEGDTAPATEALAERPQARSYEAFKVPDGITLDGKQVKSFTDVLDDGALSHQERGQKLMDMHVADLQRVVQETQTHQRKVWTDYNNQLKADLKADPELGGNRADTVLGQARAVVERFGGTPEQVAETLAMMTHTGMGNFIGTARLLNNIFEQVLARQIVPGNPPSRGSGRRSFQDVAYGDGPNGAAT